MLSSKDEGLTPAFQPFGLAKYEICNEIQIPGYLVDLFRLLGRPRKDFKLELISYKMLWK